MMMGNRVGMTILGSGSSGNATLVHLNGQGVLIDAGFSLKETVARMKAMQVENVKIHGILVTHEHDDHVKGLRVCSNYFQVPVFTTAKCAEKLHIQDPKLNQMVRISPGGQFALGCFAITPFSIPHDAQDPVGFVVYCNQIKLAVATDIGYASANVEYELKGCNTLLLESNHDIQMLAASKRPWNIKQRILGRQGHLCNETTAELLKKIVCPQTKNIALGHVSRECNKEELVFNSGIMALQALGRTDINLKVAKQDEPLATLWC